MQCASIGGFGTGGGTALDIIVAEFPADFLPYSTMIQQNTWKI